MPDIFGLDLAGIIDDSIQSAGGTLSVSLVKVTPGTRTTGDLAAGTNAAEGSPLRGRGFFDDAQLKRMDSSLVQQGDRVVLVFGASIPGRIPPEPDDILIVEDEETETLTIISIIERDPAAATYICHTRKT